MIERGATAYPYRGWADAERVAAEHFHVRAFRPGQRELIEAVLSGRDVFGVLPTGGGKSLTFQLPSLFLDRAVVVVSPLLALIRDQNEKLEGFDVPAARIDSTLQARDARRALTRVGEGRLDVLYVTPEGLRRAEVCQALAAKGVALFVVDEAHCVSSWGHDFRPAYLGLADTFEALGRPPVLALTATATEHVARDVVEQLRLRAPLVVRTSCERTNLHLTVLRTPSPEHKRAALDALLTRERGGAGIIYTTTVKRAEALWTELCERLGEGIGRYHGDLPRDVRSATQDAFMDGRYHLMVATKAFGMGIDKPDVRFIVHDTFPESLEAYLQEAGRAGRDGAPARATLLYQLEDKRVHDYFLGSKYASAAEIDRLLEALVRRGGDRVRAKDLAAPAAVAERKVMALLYALARLGAVAPRGESFAVTDAPCVRAAGPRLTDEADALREADRARIRAMMRYGERVECRWGQLRAHFGEPRPISCGRCDVCDSIARAERCVHGS